jgi:hypothetical protein
MTGLNKYIVIAIIITIIIVITTFVQSVFYYSLCLTQTIFLGCTVLQLFCNYNFWYMYYYYYYYFMPYL